MMEVSLASIIDNIMLFIEDENHYLYGKSRTLIVKYAKRVIQELNYAGMKCNAYFVAEPDKVNAIPLPDDFVTYTKVFYVIDNMLFPAFNNSDFNLGAVTEGEGLVFGDYHLSGVSEFNDALSSNLGYRVNIADYIASLAKGYKFDYKNRRMVFDYVPYQSFKVLIEYISDPLVGKNGVEDIYVNKLFEKAVEAGVYYRMVENLRDVPMNEKIRAKREWNIKYRDAVKESNAKPNEFVQVLLKQKFFNI